MSQQIRFAPLRDISDMIGSAEKYAIPNFNDLARVNNRITNNLLYYQSNYIGLFFLVFILISLLHPQQFITGLIAFVAIFVLFIFMSNKSVEMQRMKRDKPFLTFTLILVIAGFTFKLFGSLLVFLFSVCLPLSLVFVHALLRTRNLNNKLANKVEMIGWARTPMGWILEQLGATNEVAS